MRNEKITDEIYYQSLIEATADALRNYEYEDAAKFAASLRHIENKMLADGKFVSSKKITEMGISRQRLHYWVQQGYVRTMKRGKQNMYLLEDINRMVK